MTDGIPGDEIESREDAQRPVELDVLERCERRIADTDREALYAAVEEIKRLREIISRRGKLLADVFNCDAAWELPTDISKRINDELIGKA